MVNQEIEKAVAIAQKGISFEIIRRSQAFPPFSTLNSFFKSGVDDAASGVTINWEPFELCYEEYLEFFRICKEMMGPLAIRDLNADHFEAWFSRLV